MRQTDANVFGAWPDRSLLMWGAIIGSAIGAVSSAFGASQQNKAAKKAASAQMDFQERMSNTQYQRTMADMRAAGLNPILAYKQGGAGTPGGSTYSPANVGAAAATGASQGAASAVALIRQNQELKNLKATENLTKSQIEAQAGARAAARMEEKAYQGPNGYLMWLLKNGKGGDLSKLFQFGLGAVNTNSGKSARRSTRSWKIPGRYQRPRPKLGSKNDNSFSKWMHRNRKRVFGKRPKFQRGNIDHLLGK